MKSNDNDNLVASRIKNQELVKKKHAHIANAAYKLFIKKGYNQTSIRDISRAAGMAMGNLYDYISNKEDILYLVYQEHYNRLRKILYSEDLLKSKNPRESLILFIANFLKNKKLFAHESQIIRHELRYLSKNKLTEAYEKEAELIRKLEQIIQSGVKQNVFNTETPYFTACFIISQLNIWVMNRWTFKEKYSEQEADNLVIDHIMKLIGRY